jgi:hypothetical protein
LYVVLLDFPQKIGIVMPDRVNERATKDDLIIRCLKFYVRRLITGFVCGCTVLLGEPTSVQDGARICPVYISEFIVTVKMIIAIVVVALAAHNTPLCHLMVRRALVRDFLPTSSWYKDDDRLSKAIPHL